MEHGPVIVVQSMEKTEFSWWYTAIIVAVAVQKFNTIMVSDHVWNYVPII